MRHLRQVIYERANGLCEVSGLPLGDLDGPWELHHRRPKGMGGTLRPDTDTPSNALALLAAVHNGGWPVFGWPNNLSVHGDRTWSEARGYLITQGSPEPPSALPVLLHGQSWVMLGASRYFYL